MHRYIEVEVRRRYIRDLQENLHKYLNILKELAQQYGGKAYIFGSRARGNALPSSGVDIPIVIPDNVDRLKVLHEARKKIRNPLIDIHVLNESDAKTFIKLLDTIHQL